MPVATRRKTAAIFTAKANHLFWSGRRSHFLGYHSSGLLHFHRVAFIWSLGRVLVAEAAAGGEESSAQEKKGTRKPLALWPRPIPFSWLMRIGPPRATHLSRLGLDHLALNSRLTHLCSAEAKQQPATAGIKKRNLLIFRPEVSLRLRKGEIFRQSVSRVKVNSVRGATSS
jgi:hypothetical protein